MSKTDKHRPFRAQIADSPREWHDHRDGVCTLPTLEEWQKMSKREQHSWRSCGWQPSNWHTYKGFGRSKGEKFWRTEDRKRKDSKRAKDDFDLDFDTDDDYNESGCMWCSDHG